MPILGLVLSLALMLSQQVRADDAFLVKDPTSHLTIAVASEGHTDKALPTFLLRLRVPAHGRDTDFPHRSR